MAEILIPGTWQVQAVGILPTGRQWINNFYVYVGAGALDLAGAEAIAAEIEGAYEQLIAVWHITMSLTNVVVTDRRTEGAAQYDVPLDDPVVGVLSDAPLPGQTQALVSWITAFRGRAGRGRTYLAGFTEAGSAGGALEAGVEAQVEGFIAVILAADHYRVASLYDGVVLATSGSRRLKPKPRDAGVTNAITAGIVRPHWATQRRRALPVG